MKTSINIISNMGFLHELNGGSHLCHLSSNAVTILSCGPVVFFQVFILKDRCFRLKPSSPASSFNKPGPISILTPSVAFLLFSSLTSPFLFLASLVAFGFLSNSNPLLYPHGPFTSSPNHSQHHSVIQVLLRGSSALAVGLSSTAFLVSNRSYNGMLYSSYSARRWRKGRVLADG